MAQRSHVPKFGNWEGEENVPYTVFFEKARQGRTGRKIVNPNDPQESPDLYQDYVAQTGAPPASRAKAELDEPVGHGPSRRSHERGRSREEVDFRQYADSPARHDNVNRRPSGDSTPSRYGRGVNSGEAPKRPTRPSVGSEHSIEKSPLHSHARVTGRGSMPSPAWEGKNSYDSSHGTPVRSKIRPSTRGDESPDTGAAVPKFGDWDENNPASADGYTHIFNKVREERNNAGNVPGMPGEQSPYRNVRNREPAKSSSKSCCFPWCRK
ncbi:hypothetical protein DITRI_Ditri13aG0117900 [Diplodiscus trichospermus]